MRLTVLGCNGTYPTSGRPSSGYLIRTEQATVWLDCGTGTFAALQEYVDPNDLDAIVITHEHVDHCVDVLPFAYSRRYGHPFLGPVPVYAPASVPKRLEALIGRTGSAVFEALAFHRVDLGTEVDIKDLHLVFTQTNHPVPTMAVKLMGSPGSIAYTADTGVTDHLAGWAAGSDVLLAEASYLGSGADKPWPHHLTASEAGELATAANVGRLVLTHLWPTNDPGQSVEEASETFSGSVVAATPGLTIDLKESNGAT